MSYRCPLCGQPATPTLPGMLWHLLGRWHPPLRALDLDGPGWLAAALLWLLVAAVVGFAADTGWLIVTR